MKFSNTFFESSSFVKKSLSPKVPACLFLDQHSLQLFYNILNIQLDSNYTGIVCRIPVHRDFSAVLEFSDELFRDFFYADLEEIHFLRQFRLSLLAYTVALS